MIKPLLLVALCLGVVLWLTRPYSFDLIRYAAWRVQAGRAFVHGSVGSGDADIGYRTIGPEQPGGTTPAPLVLLHGGFGTDLDWYAEIPSLAQHHALVLIDTRGHGTSTLGEQPLSSELLAGDVLAVLNKLGIDRVDVAGWSDGGNTGLQLARQHPSRVRRLVAISINARPDALLPRVREALAQGPHMGSIASRLLRALFSPEPECWDTMARGVTDLWRTHPRLDESDLSAIEIPTLIIAGSKDDMEPAHLDELERTIPNARLAILPDIGHFVPQSAARQVLQLIRAFLDDA